jgi:hypothetical protein
MIEQVAYKGWPHCWRIANETIELIATADVGPRLIRFAFLGAENEFHEFAVQAGLQGGTSWRSYGGHRLWHAPEAQPRTYAPDNSPVAVEERGSWLCLMQPTEPSTGIEKELHLRLEVAPAGEGRVTLRHILRNRGSWPVELAPWALTVMAGGGTAIIPLPPRGTHEENLLPNGSLAMWPYTNLQDARWGWLNRHILLRQDQAARLPQKLGARITAGWLAYARAGHLFAKRFAPHPSAPYPDFGSNIEVYTDAEMLELETLGPLVRLAEGEATEHIESWRLARLPQMPTSDDEIDRWVGPKIVG